VKLGEINMTPLIILNKTQVLFQGKILALCLFHPVSQEWFKLADKASLLTAFRQCS
jgi:hypothetical protein